MAELFTDVQVFDPDSRTWVDVSGSYSDLYGGTPKTAIFSDGKIYLLSNLAFGSGMDRKPLAGVWPVERGARVEVCVL